MGPHVSGTETIDDLRDLRAFCRVVDLGSLTAAANDLRETKGSISRRLSRLERQLGVVLIRRSPRLVQPTEDGIAYRARLARVLELLDDANAKVRHGHDEPHGNLRVTAPIDFGDIILAPIVARFCENYPDVTVEMILTDQRLDFDVHQIDVAIRASFGPLVDSALTARKLVDLHAKLFATRAYLKKNGTPRDVEGLARHRVLVSGVPRRSRMFELRRLSDPRAPAVTVRATLSASDFTFVREVGLSNGGIALLPSTIARSDVAARRLVAVLDDWAAFSASIYLMHHGTRFVAPKVRAFRDFILDELRPRRSP